MIKNNECKSNRQRIDSLQALRTLAFLGIFFSHANFFISWPCLGVSIFFVMSGFLMMYGYGSKELSSSLKNNVEFSIKRIKKLYPLHIITMLLAIILNLIITMPHGITVNSIIVLIKKIIFNITLMQTWYPHSSINVSLNGVAWYLSVMMFLYFVFPYLQAFIKKTKLYKLCIISVALLCLQIISCIPFIHFLGCTSPTYVWFMYCFPVFRMGDFFVGCVLERLYIESNINGINKIVASGCEITAVVITVLMIRWLRMGEDNIVLLAFHNSTTLYIPLAVCWIYLFTTNKGIITRIFVNKLFVYMGNISSYLFLIHYVVTEYTIRIIGFLNIDIVGIDRAILVGIELMVSVLLSIGYKKICERRV